MVKHTWVVTSYALSKDRLKVSIGECCKSCGQERKYERPNKRLSAGG